MMKNIVLSYENKGGFTDKVNYVFSDKNEWDYFQQENELKIIPDKEETIENILEVLEKTIITPIYSRPFYYNWNFHWSKNENLQIFKNISDQYDDKTELDKHFNLFPILKNKNYLKEDLKFSVYETLKNSYDSLVSKKLIEDWALNKNIFFKESWIYKINLNINLIERGKRKYIQIIITDSWAWKNAETTIEKWKKKGVYMWWAWLWKKWIKEKKFTRTIIQSNTLDWYQTIILKKIVPNKNRYK